ncbi:MAG: hypothetical protein RL368_1674 [Pseudomonadota bacterium]|jgi:4-diphosphocytidyl-2-C-methyl-D-erythritol kinase
MSLPLLNCPAPAKLNLFLHITGRRADGYHNLQTLFQFLSFGDTLNFYPNNTGEIQLSSSATNLPPEQDLVYKAARLLQDFSNCSQGARIQVEKRIPMGGGLGGGSSDAATTLLALNKLWNLQLPLSKLAELGLKLGADVPVFIYGKATWAEGVGEIFTPVMLHEPYYLVVHPQCHVPTREIFMAEDLTRDSIPIRICDFNAGQSQNDCETVVRRRYPEVAKSLDWLQQFGSAKMTGTGACVFVSFPDLKNAHLALQQLPSKWTGFVAQGRNHSPAHQALQYSL